MNQNPSTKPGISSLETLLLSVVIILVAAFVISYYVEGNRALKERRDVTRAIYNAKNLGIALMHFEADYGRLPDAHTAMKVAASGHDYANLAISGNTANDHLRQLIAAGILDGEEFFHTATAEWKRLARHWRRHHLGHGNHTPGRYAHPSQLNTPQLKPRLKQNAPSTRAPSAIRQSAKGPSGWPPQRALRRLPPRQGRAR